MPVYVDNMKLPFKGRLMSHMTADTLSELHNMADVIGMKRAWFQCPPNASYPHHDIDEVRRDLAITNGALPVSNKAGLHYAAKLGVEWAAQIDDPERQIAFTKKYLGVMRRTRRYLP